MEILNHSQAAKDCMIKTDRCRKILEQTFVYCTTQGGSYAEREVLNSISDCIDMCQLNGDFIMRNSQFRGQSASLCAQICDDAADQSGRFSDDEKMIFGSAVCRDCAVSCRDFIDREHIS